MRVGRQARPKEAVSPIPEVSDWSMTELSEMHGCNTMQRLGALSAPQTSCWLIILMNFAWRIDFLCLQVAVLACQLVVHCRRQADMGILQKPDFDDIVRKKSMQASDSTPWSVHVVKPTCCHLDAWPPLGRPLQIAAVHGASPLLSLCQC